MLIVVVVLIGFTIMARTDGVFLLIAILLDRFIDWKWWQSRREIRSQVISGLTITVSCSLVIFPWILWNLMNFNNIFQVSGLALFWQSHFGEMDSLTQFTNSLIRSSHRMLFGTIFFTLQTSFMVLLVSTYCIITGLMRKSKYKSRHKENSVSPPVVSLRFLYMYAILILLFFAVYLWHHRFWYFMPILFVASVLSGTLYGNYVNMLKLRNTIVPPYSTAGVILILLVISIAMWWPWHAKQFRLYPVQMNALKIAEWISVETEPDARIGVWNSGIIGYLSDRTTINLDGVVNNDLYDFVKNKNVSFYDLCGIWDYIQESDLDYLTDYDARLPDVNENDFSGYLELSHTISSVRDSGTHPVRVFRIIKSDDNSSKHPCDR